VFSLPLFPLGDQTSAERAWT